LSFPHIFVVCGECSIVKEYIAGNGGTLQIESEQGKGTRIVLTLPAAG